MSLSNVPAHVILILFKISGLKCFKPKKHGCQVLNSQKSHHAIFQHLCKNVISCNFELPLKTTLKCKIYITTKHTLLLFNHKLLSCLIFTKTNIATLTSKCLSVGLTLSRVIIKRRAISFQRVPNFLTDNRTEICQIIDKYSCSYPTETLQTVYTP